MKLRVALPILAVGLAIGCSRSGLDALGGATSTSGDDATVGGGFDDGGPSSSGVTSGAGGGGSVGSGSASSSGPAGGGIDLACMGSADCSNGQACCATVNLSGGPSVASIRGTAPCAAGAYQLCVSSRECFGGATCAPNALGMGPMICTRDAGSAPPAMDATAACSTPNAMCRYPIVLPLSGDPVACGLTAPDASQRPCTALCHPAPGCSASCWLQVDAGANEVYCLCDCTVVQ
jgi:hypothetical protein